jgi:hypothetical protein
MQAPSFDKVARICEGPQLGACVSEGACVPPTPPGFGPSHCVYKQVDDTPNPTCPTGYSPLTFFYKAIIDMRGCTQCQCGAPTGRACQISAEVFPTNTCSAGTGVPQTLNDCSLFANPLLGATIPIKINPGMPSGGACNSLVASTPTGEAYGSYRTLVCCLP